MILGTAQIDITPPLGCELSGFAARQQPSTGLLDPLFAKVLYLATSEARLLWIHCDLIGFDQQIVADFRQWARTNLGLLAEQVILSATHTHSGPATIQLREAGEYDAAYVALLHHRLRQGARIALQHTEPVGLTIVEGQCDLAVERRQTATPHTDPRVAALGFRRPNGDFAAVLVNYAMHPLALGAGNRWISADIFGAAAVELAQTLPGAPVVLFTNGACGNLNPPAENASFEQVKLWGRQLAAAVGPQLKAANFDPQPRLNLTRRLVQLPLDTLDADGINQFASQARQNPVPLGQWGDKYIRVVEHWRTARLQGHSSGSPRFHEAELFAVTLNDVLLLGANAEVFSEFTDWLRRERPAPTYLVGYANGDLGYLPTRAAYAEGGYEVDVAHLFYGVFRSRSGGLELLASAAAELIREFPVQAPQKRGMSPSLVSH